MRQRAQGDGSTASFTRFAQPAVTQLDATAAYVERFCISA
jgi:hypothetical protein